MTAVVLAVAGIVACDGSGSTGSEPAASEPAPETVTRGPPGVSKTQRAERDTEPGGTAWVEPDSPVELTDQLEFAPERIRVTAGDTVRWTNGSALVHTVTVDPAEATREQSTRLPERAEPFDSGSIDPGGSFEHTFTAPGTYKYFCKPHEGAKMYGWVKVVPAP